jgi:endonuclease/exonuclease/phosphatase family metal-dependent hydrolase
MKTCKVLKICSFILVAIVLVNCNSKNVNNQVVNETDQKSTIETTTNRATTSGVFNIMTYNLRFDSPSDGINRWPNRKNKIANLILRHNPDLMGFQEDSYIHVTDLDALLTDYKWIGYGAINGVNGNDSEDAIDHLNSIFYNTQRLNLLEQGVFWYADDTSIPDATWSEGYYRTCVWAKFKERQSDHIFYHFNTHLQHKEDEDIRLIQAQLLLSKIHEITQGDFPLTLTGDFNTIPSSVTYSLLSDNSSQVPLIDTKNNSALEHEGTDATFFGFDAKNENGKEIDFIFQFQFKNVLFHKTINDYNDWFYPSDHCPVLTQISLNE